MLLEPIKSIVDFPFYRQVTQKSIGRAIGYIAYVGFLFSIVSTVAMYVKVSPILKETVDWASTSIPPLTFANGKVTSNLTAPILIRHPRLSEIAIMIDTNRVTPVTPDEMAQHQLTAYLTQTNLYIVTSGNKMEIYDLANAKAQGPIVINADFYRKAGHILSMFLYPIAWLTTLALFFVWKLLAALVYSVVGLAINAATSAGLDYERLFKLAVYAQTPVILLQCVLLFLPRQIPGFFVIGFLVVGIYTWQAIKQQAPDQQAPETPNPA